MFRKPTCLFSILFATAAGPAAASSSAWIESDGGAVRIVTTGLSGENGELRGALEIRLKPGWKTYWRNPGEAGVPPEIELSQTSDASGAELLFPAPERISDPYATWAGYRRSVALPVVFTFPQPGTAGIIEGKVFLGICETICIPVEAAFSFDAGADPGNSGDSIAVENAFAALPGKARPDFEVSEVSREGTDLQFQVNLPKDVENPALFVAPPQSVQIAMPALKHRDATTATFVAELLRGPAASDGSLHFNYTLVAGEEAVAGQIALP